MAIVTTPAQRVAFELSTKLPARIVAAKPRPVREPRFDVTLPDRLRAMWNSGMRDLSEIAAKAGCGRSTAWRHLSGKA